MYRSGWLLIDAGADTTSPVTLVTSRSGVDFAGTPLDFTNLALVRKKIGGISATERQLAAPAGQCSARRLLLREDVRFMVFAVLKHGRPDALDEAKADEVGDDVAELEEKG